MKKSDLKTGMQIETENGLRFVVMLGTPEGDVYVEVKGQIWGKLDYFTKDLKRNGCKIGTSGDIIKVYSSENADQYTSVKMPKSDLIWYRKETPVELTLEEIAEKFGVDVKNLKIKK